MGVLLLWLLSLAELGKLLYESDILHITSYFYEVMYYSYILLYQKVTLLYYYYFQK